MCGKHTVWANAETIEKKVLYTLRKILAPSPSTFVLLILIWSWYTSKETTLFFFSLGKQILVKKAFKNSVGKVPIYFILVSLDQSGSFFSSSEDKVTWPWDFRKELNLTVRVAYRILKFPLTILEDDLLALLTGVIYTHCFSNKQKLGSAPSYHRFLSWILFNSIKLCH